MQKLSGLYILDDSAKGRGVYTALPLSPEDTIEICPVIVIPEGDVPLIHASILHNYYFTWPDGQGSIALALGYGSMYNHSPNPNATWIMDIPRQEMIVRCISPIPSGSEISIDYTGGTSQLPWFDVLT